jgi:hypothetical protein
MRRLLELRRAHHAHHVHQMHRRRRAPRGVALFLVSLASMVATSSAVAQGASAWRAGVGPAPTPASRPPLYAPLASLAIPGAGQYQLGDDRSIAYGAVEVVGWFLYLKDRQDERHQEAAFKDLARQVARAHFSTTFADAPWAYYEQLRDWQSSGVYTQSDASLVPETDTLTFNGYKWQLALRTSPTRDAALAQYQQVAIKPDFQWSWQNAQEQWTVFKQTTNNRNDADRAATRALSLIAANHILSMLDAFATIRLSIQPTADGGTRVGATLKW